VTNDAWDEGMALLEANLRDRDLTPGMKSLRGATLRAAMNHLSDEQWGGVVQEALRSPTGWFPVLGELEDYAARLPQATHAHRAAGRHAHAGGAARRCGADARADQGRRP
jgi:hypothetical protein